MGFTFSDIDFGDATPEEIDLWHDIRESHMQTFWQEGTPLGEYMEDFGPSLYREWKTACKKLREKKRDAERADAERQRMLDRADKERQRMRERAEEQERRDPTPILQRADFPADIPDELRPMHVCVPGGTQRGKTNFLRQLVLADIKNDFGVGVLDPKGTLITGVVNELPKTYKDRTIYLDLKTPVPIDFMSHTDAETEALVGDLKYLVLKGDDSLKRAEPILTDLIYSLLACEGTTFLDIHHFFKNKMRRDAILEQLKQKDPDLWDRWKLDFPSDTEVIPIISRMNPFVRNPSLRAIFDHSKATLNINNIINDGSILLVNLEGIGETRKIFGSLLVSKFQQAAFRRAGLHKDQIRPFCLYVDEFEYFQTSTFDEIFSVAGGLGLYLTIGNQYINQLDPKIRSAVLGNAGSYVIFQIGPEDLHLFTHKIQPYHVKHLEGLHKYQACFKIGSNPPIWKWIPAPPPQDQTRIERRIQKLKEQTIETYRFPSAQSGQNRTSEQPGCDTQTNVLSLEDGVPPDSGTEKPEAEPSGEPDVPPHKD